MISRIAIRALATAAVFAVPLTAAAPAMAQSWIHSAGVHAEYNPLDAQYGAGLGRHLPVVIAVEPRSMSSHAVARAVATGMRGVEGPSPSQVEAMLAPMRVVWTFDDGWWSTAGACKRSFASSSSKLTPAVVRFKLLVTATLCRGETALSQVVGFTDLNPNLKSPIFAAFVGDMTSALFPATPGGRTRR